MQRREHVWREVSRGGRLRLSPGGQGRGGELSAVGRELDGPHPAVVALARDDVGV
jgi:hypothetical protein